MPDLYLMNPDGSDVRRVFKRKRKAYRYAPTWSPDGKQIAYVHYNWNGVTFTIYIATLGAQKEKRVVEGWDPTWAPDGKEIAYTAYFLNGRRVTLIDIHTQKQKRLLPRTATPWQNHLSWSAVGDKIVFSWNQNPLPPLLGGDHLPPEWLNRETIYSVNRDGMDIQQLISETGPRAQYPVVSPHGDELLYTQEIKGRLQLFKRDLNNGIRTQLTYVGRVYHANVGGDWFDPAYLLSVSPQPQLITTTWGNVKKR